MEILENQQEWLEHFRQNWLVDAEENGKPNWKVYQHPRNSSAPGVAGVDLGTSRLLLVTSTGAYLRESQQSFDAESLFGDYTARSFPITTTADELAYAHTHYDHTAIEEDMQVAIPLGHLRELVEAGRIGELAPQVISFMGYEPNSSRVVDELVPQVVALAKEQGVQAALLAPV